MLEICIETSVSLTRVQPRTNIVEDEKGDLVAHCHSILARWKNHFSQLLNVHRVNEVGRLKYIQQFRLCLSAESLRLRWLLKS